MISVDIFQYLCLNLYRRFLSICVNIAVSN
jgi:hypothetical protein